MKAKELLKNTPILIRENILKTAIRYRFNLAQIIIDMIGVERILIISHKLHFYHFLYNN